MTTPVPVVLLPGLMQDARVFAPQIDGLSRDRAVMVAPTHHHDTVKAIAQSVLDTAPARFAVVGLSLGGGVALELLRLAADRIDRICLISTSAMSEPPDTVAGRDVHIAGVKGGRFGDVMETALGINQLAESTYRLEIANLARNMATGLGEDAFVRQSNALQRRKDQQATLRKINCPALVMCGKADRMYPLKRHEFMAEMIPRSTLATIPDAAHLVTLEQPAAVNDALRGWLA